MRFKIAVLPGDGIGPEIVSATLVVLNSVATKYDHEFDYREALMGGIAIDETGNPLPEETLELATSSDAVLLGAIGGPKWDTTDPKGVRPEQGLLGIRKALELFANLRPVPVFDALIDSSTLKPEVIRGVDILVVRELTGGLYFGASAREGDRAYDTMDYHVYEIERIVRKAMELARGRKKIVHSIDKANVLESSRLWREVTTRIAAEYPDVHLEHMLVDNCAMQIIRHPEQFDVMVTENMFGDILSDEASMLSGSLGMLSSASLGAGHLALYEPSHGSAPKHAGKDVANPIATVLSAALMLRYSFELDAEARAVEAAVTRVLDEGFRTRDIEQESTTVVGTARMGELIAERV
ncbi:MAG: 3-isopropylmalate dehydrogenase [Actinobacteria bacterium]|nr:MAG: 3-isopropylmalate dehydrogenase [Actinomycetota bacterium]